MKSYIVKDILLIFAIILSCLAFVSLMALSQPQESKYYPTCGTVTTLDEKRNTVTFEDSEDRAYTFRSVEDWAQGDIVAAIVDDCGTPQTADDVVISARYCGQRN